ELKVAKAYIPLQELKQLQKVANHNLEYLRLIKTVATTLYENDAVSLADVLRIDLNIQQLESRIKLLDEREKPLTIGLNNILNQPDSFKINYDSLKLPNDQSVVPDLESHPVVQEMNYRKQAGDAKIQAIDKSSLPKFGVGIDYVFVDERTDMNVPDNGQNALMPMVSFTLPIFRKKYRSAINEVELQNESFELMETSRINSLSTAYEDLSYHIYSENEKWRLYNELEKQTETINRLLLTEYETAGKNLNDLLQIQLQLLDYQEKKINACANLNINYAEVKYLIKK
ncbi:MAG: TolC family protein, partial [Fulvivirga sp.]